MQGLGLQGQLPAILRASFQLLRRGQPLASQHGKLGRLARQPREFIDRGQLLRGILQAQLVVLPVDGDDLRGELPQHARGNSLPGQVRPGTPGRGHRPGGNVLPLVGEPPELRDDLLDAFLNCRIVVGKDPLHAGPLRTSAHLRGIRPVAGEQTQAADHHRFAGTRFTGDDGQSAGELGGGFFDHTEVGDV